MSGSAEPSAAAAGPSGRSPAPGPGPAGTAFTAASACVPPGPASPATRRTGSDRFMRFAAIRRGYARRSGRPAPPEADAVATKDAVDGAPGA